MDHIIYPEVITAIADPEFEGLVSETLYKQGWNVIVRALDVDSLKAAVNSQSEDQLLIIYSADLPGLTAEVLDQLSTFSVTLFGFSDAMGANHEFSNLSERPKSATELMEFIRGNIRAPSLRTPMLQKRAQIKSQIVAVGSVGHQTGNTISAINIAAESVALGFKTLLIDANLESPAIAAYLQVRKLSEEVTWLSFADKFYLMEVTHASIDEFNLKMLQATMEFETIIIDLGNIKNLITDLTDRRWGSRVKIWATNFAQTLCVTSASGAVGAMSLKNLQMLFTSISLQTKIIYFDLNQSSRANEPVRESKSSLSNSANRERVQRLPWDPKSIAQAVRESSTLISVNERSPIRKEYARLTREILQSYPS